MSLTRRQFLQNAALSVPAAMLTARGLGGGVMAAPLPGQARNLILIELTGGNDGLNTLPPWGYPAYYQVFRPTIAIPSPQVLRVPGQSVGFNPALASLKAHFDAGRLALIQGVSNPNPSRSHQNARFDWQSGTPGTQKRGGWLARYLNLLPASAGPVAFDQFYSQTLLMNGATSFVPNFRYIMEVNFPGNTWYHADQAARRTAYARMGAGLATGTLPVNIAALTASNEMSLITAMQTVPQMTYTGVYPAGLFGLRLQQIARLINANAGYRFFHVGMGGFDSHASQNVHNEHGVRLKTLSDSIGALYDDLNAIGVASDTLIVIYSEFGRTVYENSAFGTDHGTVNPVMVLGGAGVKGGFTNPHPIVDPAYLDPLTSELQMQVDNRDVFGTILMRWLGLSQADANTVFAGHAVNDLGFLL